MVKRKLPASFGASLVVLSSLFYASYGIWTKLMGNFFDGYTATVIRSVLVVIILLAFSAGYRKFEPLKLKENGPYILGMLVASMFTWGPLYYAIVNGGVGISLAINYAAIVIGSFFFGWLLIGENFTKEKMLAAFFGLVGLGLIFSPSFSGFGLLTSIAALVSGLFSSLGIIFAKRIHYGSTQSTLVWWTTSIVANEIGVLVLSKTYPAFHGQIEWVYMLLFAMASVVASWSLVRGVKLISAGAAGILGLLEIVFGVAFGVLFFGERPSLVVLLGMGIIIIAAAIPYARYSKMK